MSQVNAPLIFPQSKESSFLDSNIGVAKCYNLVFSLNNKMKNIGFLSFSFLILIYIIFLISFLTKGINPVKDFLFNQMIRFGYLKENHKNFFENKDENDKVNPMKKNIKNITTQLSKKNNNEKVINIKNFITNINYNVDKNNIQSKIGLNHNKSNKKLMKKRSRKKLNFIEKKNYNELNEGNNFGIIKIDLYMNRKNYTPLESNQSLHNYTFDEAIKYDRRNIFRIFYIYLLSKQIIFRTFLSKNPLELFSIRFTLFIFMLSCDLALNALFYMNDNISKKYHYASNLFLFTFSNNITIIIYSTLLSYFLLSLITKLTNSGNAIRNVFRKEEQKMKKNKKYVINDKIKENIFEEIEKILKALKIKIFFLFVIQIILIIFFWYFVTAFCHVYSSTQTSWLLDSFLSILSRFIIELIFAFLYAKLYRVAVGSNCETLYKIVICIYDFS